MIARPEVSIVMSAYNGALHFAETMDSILSQDSVDFEFIVVNDGSDDETGRLLEQYAEQDNRIRAVHQSNMGLTRALIRGCNLARGDFIARQDVGDISLPLRLKKQVAALKSEECVFVSCWTDIIGPNREFLYSSRGTGKASRPIGILTSEARRGVVDGPTHHSTVAFRKEQYAICGGYRPEFYYAQDWDLWYRIASLGKFYIIPETLCICRFALGSISGQYREKQEQFAELAKKAMLARRHGFSDKYVLDDARKIIDEFERSRSRDTAAELYFIGKCLMANRNNTAIGYLFSAIRHNPLHFRAWLSLIWSIFFWLFYKDARKHSV